MGSNVRADRTAFVDFETRSDVDLRKSGVERYCESPFTDAVCLAWAFDDAPAQGVQLLGWPDCPVELAEHVAAGGRVVAHNARFELHIWRMLSRRYGWPELRISQLVDTMAMCRTLALPGSLEQAAEALRLGIEKDRAGRALMLKLCKPRKPRKNEAVTRLLWNGTSEEFERQLAYCVRDVEVERAIFRALPQLSARERQIWELDQRINDTGLRLDADTIPHAIAAADEAKVRLNVELCALTSGQVRTANSTAAFLAWLGAGGLVLPDLRKDTVETALIRADGPRRRALEIRQEAAKSSTAKLNAMRHGLCTDGRVRGLLEYHGAATGRWAGRRVQPQNMMRTPEDFGVEDAEKVFDLLRTPSRHETLAAAHGNTMTAIAYGMRSLIVAAPGQRFLCADYSNIEGRVLAWLAGEDWKLGAFRALDAGTGHDLYKLAFAASFGVPPESVTKEQRQIGKVQELALGYQGAHGAFLSMSKNYRIDLTEVATAVKASVPARVWDDALGRYWAGAEETADEIWAAAMLAVEIAEAKGDEPEDIPDVHDLAARLARANRHGLGPDEWAAVRIIVDGWRAAHGATVSLWRALEDAALSAVASPGDTFEVAGKIKYRVAGDFLLCRLPSGRTLGYPYPRVVTEDSAITGRPQRKLEFWGISSKTRKWQKQRAYGGLLAENVTQATARDVLADALLRCDAAGYTVALHVHDEILAEVPRDFGSLGELCQIMSASAEWASGLPVAVAGWEGQRYRK